MLHPSSWVLEDAYTLTIERQYSLLRCVLSWPMHAAQEDDGLHV